MLKRIVRELTVFDMCLVGALVAALVAAEL
jgi:hypothetical protein